MVLDDRRKTLKYTSRDVVNQLVRRPFGGSLIRTRGAVNFFELDEEFLFLLVKFILTRLGQREVQFSDFLAQLAPYGFVVQDEDEQGALSGRSSAWACSPAIRTPGRRPMSATLSEVLADAILAEALQPALCGRRLLFDGLYGVDPAAVFGLLETRLDTTVSITTEAGRGEVAMRGVTAGRQLLIPYLVDDSSASENAGTAGFAATLRTQFADGPERPRATHLRQRRGRDRQLSYGAGCAPSEPLLEARDGGRTGPRVSRTQPPADADRTRRRGAVRARSARSEVSFARLSEWLKANVAANEQSLGQNLWKLGCFLADPKVHDDPPGRLTKSNALRRKLDELFASSGKSFAVEVRKLVARGGAPTEAADRIIGAAGAFELDYGAFVYEDAVRRPKIPHH